MLETIMRYPLGRKRAALLYSQFRFQAHKESFSSQPGVFNTYVGICSHTALLYFNEETLSEL